MFDDGLLCAAKFRVAEYFAEDVLGSAMTHGCCVLEKVRKLNPSSRIRGC
ncbi:MAG: hypothetical protein AAB278_00440 [Pseudomonadota bacterium]